jgi:hypothetical protein
MAVKGVDKLNVSGPPRMKKLIQKGSAPAYCTSLGCMSMYYIRFFFFYDTINLGQRPQIVE